MKYFFYKKEKKEIVPIKLEDSNNLAKAKLDEFFKNKDVLRIPSKFLKNWNQVALFHPKGEVEKANALLIPKDKSSFALNNTLNDLTAKEWLPETISVFSQKGLGAGNKDAQIEKQHPAPFSFQDVGKLVQFFTKEKDIILDPFSGVASTVKACAFNNRIGHGIELNPKYHKLGLERIKKEVPDDFPYKDKQNLICGSCLKETKKFDTDFFDFIVTSPPYWNILETIDHKSKERINNGLDHKYSNSTNDLANIEDYDKFVDVLATFFDSCSNILKKKKYIAIIVSDFRKKDKYYVFHADLAKEIEKKGNFVLKGIRILYQRHKSIFPYGYPFSFVPNLHHQNVLIFQNIKNDKT